jgi:diaminohydroxyphosphoribosylaminopyrimidine deaminase/5-amino-6-(5-phosphoribosylamino)uracil reductase
MNSARRNDEDLRWMRSAVLLSRYGLGRVAPNPSVGCVIVNDGRLVGRGRTADGGRPHAEAVALAVAGKAAQGATAYVTLEPCAHHGKTPPCADALIKAGVGRVVIALDDPDQRVTGKGIDRLEKAGIAVTILADVVGVSEVLAGYLNRQRTGLPLVTVKIASTLDGRIALSDGQSKWITGERSRAYVHLLRAQHDAVMTASGTVRADNPALTCRLMGYDARQPLRVVVASRFDLDPASQLAQSAQSSQVMVMVGKSDKGKSADMGAVRVVDIGVGEDGQTDIKAALRHLGGLGINAVLVEAGGRFVASMLKAGLVDRLIWTRSAGVIGADGLASLAGLGLADLSDGRLFSRFKSFIIDDDMIEIFCRR